jgi:hypothetical protein
MRRFGAGRARHRQPLGAPSSGWNVRDGEIEAKLRGRWSGCTAPTRRGRQIEPSSPRWEAATPVDTTPGGQPRYSTLAIATALTLRAVFRLALRQTEGLIGSVRGSIGECRVGRGGRSCH